jgi:hypothetical protein
MTDEPRYVENDSDGVPIEEEDLSWQTTSGIDNLAIIERAQKICRRPRNPFHSKAEKNKYLKIDKQYSKGMISDAWLENCYDWAWKKNGTTLAITMPKLASLILNKARMTDFNARLDEDMGVPSQDDRDLADEGF